MKKPTPETKQMHEEKITRVKTNRGYLTADGREIPNGTPMAPPIGYRPPDPLHLKIRQMIISEKLAREAAEAGMETFEEADDFDTGEDDLDPTSPYEEQFDPAGYDPGAARRFVEEQARAARQAQEAHQARNAPRGSAEQQDLPDQIDQAPLQQQPTGGRSGGGGAAGGSPGTPPAEPPPQRPKGRSFFRLSE